MYAVGSLLHTYGAKPILCLTIFKDKLSVARLMQSDYEHDNSEAVAGAVSLKYVISPSPMNLKTEKGNKDL